MKQRINVTVVDDNRTLGYLVSETVRDYFEEKRLRTGQVYQFLLPTEALIFISNQMIDVLITDLQMPKMSGEELIAQVRAMSPMTAVVLMTGCRNYQPPTELGVVGFLEKPFEDEELFVLLDKALEGVVSNID